MRPLFLVLVAFASAPAAAQSANQMLEIWPGPEGSLPSFRATEDELYIAADDGVHGRELWHIEDGQPALLIDLNPGPASADVRLLASTGPLFFAGDDGTGSRLWRNEGSVAVPVAGTDGLSVGSGFTYTEFPYINGRLVFAAYRPEYGSEPWLIEGDSARILADMAPGPASSSPRWFYAVGGMVYFNSGGDLVVTDLDTAWVVFEYQMGPELQPLIVHEDRLYFLATTEVRGHELWVADSSGVVTPLPEAYPGPDGLAQAWFDWGAVTIDESLYLMDSSVERGDLVWQVRNDSLLGPTMLRPPYQPPGGQWGALFRGVAGGEMVIDQYEQVGSSQVGFIWRGDGQSFRRIHEFTLGNDPIYSNAQVNDRVYYTVQTFEHGFEVFEVYGDTVRMVLPEIAPGSGPQGGANYLGPSFEGRLYLSGNDRVNGTEPWVVTPLVVDNESGPARGESSRVMVRPNPAQRAAVADIELEVSQEVGLEVVDVVGRRVYSLSLGRLPPGHVEVPIPVDGLSPGAYVVVLRAGSELTTARLVAEPR
jgi:ELWxxDGT repeat protein